MKCFTCGTNMKCFDDASCVGYGWVNLLKCPKCNSYAEERVLDGFKKEVHWKSDYPKTLEKEQAKDED